MDRKNFIISADDFGLNDKATSRILELAESGKLDRAAVMAFGTYSEEQARKLLDSGVKIDIHLHMERMRPDPFLNKGETQGIMKRLWIFLGLIFSEGNAEKVKIEWQSQLDEFRKVFGRNPDGINSHEHIHFFPKYFRVVLDFQKTLALPYFRFGKRGIVGMAVAAMILRTLAIADRKIIKKDLDTLPSSEYFISFDWMSDPASELKKIPSDGTTELLFHPLRDGEYEFLKKNL